MKESTFLSRSFADQGVKLRIRKEPRTMMYVCRAAVRSVSHTDSPGNALIPNPMSTHLRRCLHARQIAHPCRCLRLAFQEGIRRRRGATIIMVRRRRPPNAIGPPSIMGAVLKQRVGWLVRWTRTAAQWRRMVSLPCTDSRERTQRLCSHTRPDRWWPITGFVVLLSGLTNY
jgi:hypothetical protein